jgi:hypothetical protein
MNVALVVSRMGISSPLLSFDTHSTTGNMPGVAIGPASNAEAVAGKSLGVLGGLRSGLPKETEQTIQKVDNQLQTYFAARHWTYKKAP